MNSLFAHGIKQIQSVKKDLNILESNTNAPLSTQGSVSVSLGALNRTILELEELISKESDKPTQEKLEKRVQKFQTEAQELKNRFSAARQKKASAQLESGKSELFNRSRHPVVESASTSTDNPYSSFQEGYYKERDTLSRSSRQLDEILEMGQQSFDDIVTQNEYLQKFEKKLASSLATLGVSRSTIADVERRVYKDRFIFFGGAIFTFICFYLIYRYLG